jgi:plasmid stability protein
MGQVIIRKLDDEVIAAHKRRAAARGVSLEQQLRDVLAEAAKPSRGGAPRADGRMPGAHPARSPQAGGEFDSRRSRQPMTLVVDASVALKWFVEEDGSPRAVSLLGSLAGR